MIVFPKTVALPCTVPAALIPVCTELIRYFAVILFAVILPVVLIELLPNDPNNVTTFESPYDPPPPPAPQYNTPLPYVVNTLPLEPPVIVTLPTAPKLAVLLAIKLLAVSVLVNSLKVNVDWPPNIPSHLVVLKPLY